jgi:two-component system, cell cycle sensor histidine kinase and response regulator CckA
MNDNSKTKQQITEELTVMRQRVIDLEKSQNRKKPSGAGDTSFEEWYRLLFNNVSDAVFVHQGPDETNMPGTFIEVNDVACQKLGYTREELLQMRPSDIDASETIGNIPPMMKKLLKDKQAVWEGLHVSKSGRRIPVEIHNRLIDSGGRQLILSTVSDMTERKQTEETLQKSEEKYRLVVENAREAIVIVQDLKTVFVNRAATAMTGYSEEILASRSFTEFIHPHDRDMVLETHVKRLKGKKVRPVYCYRVISRDGGVKWAETNSIAIEWKGRPAVLSFINDITEREMVEEALTESQERLRILAEASYEGIALVENGVFIDLNEQLLAMLGYSREELIGRTILDVISPDDRDLVATKMVMDQTEPYEHFALRKDGSVFPVEIRARVSYIGVRRLRVSIVRDLTERKQAERNLREKQEELQTLMDASPVGISWADMQGNIQYINRKFGELFGYTLEDIPTIAAWRTVAYPDPAYRETIPPLIDLLIRARNQRKNSAPIEVAIMCKDGSRRQVIQTGAFVSNRIVTIYDDITERKNLEQRLNRAEKMEALGTLAGGVAHDLNNVLGVLVGYSELLAEMLPKDNPLRRHADNILQSSLRGAAIIQDLLTLARRGVTISEVANLNEIVSNYLRSPEFDGLKSHHPDVNFRTELEEGLLKIKGSPVHLSKTIMNLVGNAVEAISDRGKVTIKTESRYLDQPVHGYDYIEEGDYVVLTVSDTGSGISANDLGKIFEPFYTRKVMGRSGTGLGLAVVWGTVKDHHGYIDVESEKGRGSTFTLYFPVTREEPGMVERTVSPASYKGKGESILVVDDIEDQRELAKSMLERLGYHVETAASGEAAVEYLKNKRADLVVLDMIMDFGIDGMETYRRILEINPRQKAVIVSGFSETDRVKKVQEMGAGSFVRKPYILEKIGLAVRAELNRK